MSLQKSPTQHVSLQNSRREPTATHCSTLQHTATHCTTLLRPPHVETAEQTWYCQSIALLVSYKRPLLPQKTHTSSQKRPVPLQKSPVPLQKSPVPLQKSPVSLQKSPTQHVFPQKRRSLLAPASLHCKYHTRDLYLYKRALYLRERALYLRKRALHNMSFRKRVVVSSLLPHCLASITKETNISTKETYISTQETYISYNRILILIRTIAS